MRFKKLPKTGWGFGGIMLETEEISQFEVGFDLEEH